MKEVLKIVEFVCTAYIASHPRDNQTFLIAITLIFIKKKETLCLKK